MKFKEGDYFYLPEQGMYTKSAIIAGKVYKVRAVEIGCVRFDGESDGPSGNGWITGMDNLKKALKPTKLNKKLYPTYIEKDGYLIPKDLAKEE